MFNAEYTHLLRILLNWFIVLFASVAIGEGVNLGVGFTSFKNLAGVVGVNEEAKRNHSIGTLKTPRRTVILPNLLNDS